MKVERLTKFFPLAILSTTYIEAVAQYDPRAISREVARGLW